MPDYKKKKTHHKSGKVPKSTFKKVKNTEENLDIEMQPASAKNKAGDTGDIGSIRVLNGKKLIRRRNLRVLLGILAVFLITIIILSVTMPVGLGENIGNLFATIGGGSYPVEVFGTETLNSTSKGMYYYVLTDTNISAFANSGKEIYSRAHGYSKPVLKHSQTRALVFDQGGTSLKIYNLSEEVNSFQSDNPIITAAISRNGNYAVATQSQEYASTVIVFNKNGKKIYEWNSAKDIVNNVCISPSGKQIAVTVINASGGTFLSKVYAFTFDSPDPIYSYDFSSGTVPYALESSSKGFSIVTSDGYSFISWSKHIKSDIDTELEIDMFRSTNSGVLLVLNRETDRSDNRIILLSSKGEKVTEFTFKGLISDIQFARGHIYCISESKAYFYDKQGELLGTADCGYGNVRLAPIGANGMAVISDSGIQKVQIKN